MQYLLLFEITSGSETWIEDCSMCYSTYRRPVAETSPFWGGRTEGKAWIQSGPWLGADPEQRESSEGLATKV